MSENMKKESENIGKYEFLLSERLDDALKLAKISQNELSKILEVHPTTITNWKKTGKNKKGISMNMLKKIADILEVDIEYLYKQEHDLPDLSYRKGIAKNESVVNEYHTLCEYLRFLNYKIHIDEDCVVIIDANGNKYCMDDKAVKRFDAKMQAHIHYELIDNNIGMEGK